MTRADRLKSEHLEEFRRDLAMERFREERPQLWLQYQRLLKLLGIQERLDAQIFPRGHCFVHATTVSQSHFCLRRVIGIDLDTCQATFEIYADDALEDGIVVLPLETIEWFGFPATAVPVGVHFQGFTGAHGVPPSGSPASALTPPAMSPTAQLAGQPPQQQ